MRTGPDFLLALAATLLAATSASAYLVRLEELPSALDTAESVFEATITDLAADGDRGTVTVRVTSEWTRIYLGHRHLGTTRVLAFEGAATRHALERARAERGGRVLLVVGGEAGRVEVVAAVPDDVETGGYALLTPRGDGMIIFSGLTVTPRAASPSPTFTIPPAHDVRDPRYTIAALTQRWSAEATAFHAALRKRLRDGPAPDLGEETVRRALGDLGHRDWRRRAAAQRDLDAVAATDPDRLRRALATASDPEVRRRLERALADAGGRVAVERAARRLEASGAEAVAAAPSWALPTVNGWVPTLLTMPPVEVIEGLGVRR